MLQSYAPGMVWVRLRVLNTFLRVFFFLFLSLTAKSSFSVDGIRSVAKVKVAFLYAHTGANSLIENEMKKGAQIFKATHPEEVQKINLVFFDNKGSIENTLAELKKIKEQEFNYVIGLRRGEEAMAASQFAEENEMLFITPLATFSKVTLGKKNTFQIAANEVLLGAALARFAALDLKRNKILILSNNRSVFSQAFSESFEKGVKQFPAITMDRHYSNGYELSLESLQQKIGKFKPDLVFVSDEISNSAILAKYIHKIDPYLPFLTGDSFGNEKAIKLLLKDVPKMRLYFTSLWSNRKRNSENEKFITEYKKTFPKEIPSQEAGLTYDALYVLAQAIQKAGDNPSVDRVRYFLEHMSFTSTQGDLDFKSGPTHSPIKDVYIKVTKISKSKVVKTLRSKWKPIP